MACVADPPDVTACFDSRFLRSEYAYLLGLYLGCGYLSCNRKGVWHLRVVLDKRYPGIVESAKLALEWLICRPSALVSAPGCWVVQGYSKHWACVLPHVGTGMKHQRRIELQHWQNWIVERHPRPFLRGLVHSDGCRVMNRVKKGRYVYPRYHFTNVSPDIRALFQWACGLIGVESRPNNATNISVARRASIAILYEFIGPKA